MGRSSRITLPAILLSLLLVSAALGQTQPASIDPEKTLEAAGLVKAGAFYVLNLDLKLDAQAQAVRKARAQMEITRRRRADIQKDIDRAVSSLLQWQRDAVVLNNKLTGEKNARRYNEIGGQIRELDVKVAEGIKYIQKRRGDMQSLVDKQEQYITLLQSLTDRMETAAGIYARLQKDPNVQAALAKLNQQSTITLRLGPSPQFASALETFRRERKAVDTAVIKLEMRGGVPHVNVTLNGKLSLKMVLDSGASVVTLPAFIANQLGINPGKNAPAITLTTANGAKVEARIARLQSIRLGQFVAQDVECAVLPSSVPDAGCLLGSSFLRHFTYRMDLMAGQLHMSQIEEVAGDKDASNNAHDTTAPATRPGLLDSPGTKTPVLPAGWVALLTKNDLALDIRGGKKRRGAIALVAPHHGAMNQQWRFDLAEDNNIRIRNNKSNLLIGAREGKKDAGTDVIQWPPTEELTQCWTIEPVSDGYVRIVNKGSGLCLTVRDELKRGAAVEQAPWENHDTQLWRIVPLGSP